VRIVAGALRGRRLVAPPGRETRPSSDRLREALFASLADVRDDVVLDLFAGTGALGLEALSRGAARGVFCERAAPALVALRANVAALGVGARSRVVRIEAERLLADEEERRARYDLVLVDPPYAALPEVTGVLDRLLAGIVPAGGRLVIESAAGTEPGCAGFDVDSRRRIGAATLTILTRSEASP
jgi:16S rRNA (guanine966-N2)-methyltransferase